MTYDEWAASQAAPAPSTSPPPPYSMGGLQLGGFGDWAKPDVSLSQIMIPPGLRNFMGPRSAINPSFSPFGGASLSSFAPMPGERLALQLPGLSRVMDARRRLMSLLDPQLGRPAQPFFSNPPPGLRDMPRSPYVPLVPERNTEVIPGPSPSATEYPVPPWLNFRNWMDTGERGPLPLDARRPGHYPAPANTPMQEAYDALISGGALA